MGPFMACIDEAFSPGTDHGVGNPREQNLHAQYRLRPAALYGLPCSMPPTRSVVCRAGGAAR
jgi:hypothetical protein